MSHSYFANSRGRGSNIKYLRPHLTNSRNRGLKRGFNKQNRGRMLMTSYRNHINMFGSQTQGTTYDQVRGCFPYYDEPRQINETALRSHCTHNSQNMTVNKNQQQCNLITVDLTDIKEENIDIKSEQANNTETLNENKDTKEFTFIRVGIRHKEPMMIKQMVMVRRAILKYMSRFAEIAGPGMGPKFCSCYFRKGNVLVTCEDEKSKIWLEECIKGVKPWPGAELSVLPASELPQTWDASALIPTSEAETLEDIFLLLKSQNGLKVNNWKVRRHKILYNKHYLYLSIDELGVLGLKRVNFRPIVGFKKVPFWIRGVNVSIILDK